MSFLSFKCHNMFVASGMPRKRDAMEGTATAVRCSLKSTAIAWLFPSFKVTLASSNSIFSLKELNCSPTFASLLSTGSAEWAESQRPESALLSPTRLLRTWGCCFCLRRIVLRWINGSLPATSPHIYVITFLSFKCHKGQPGTENLVSHSGWEISTFPFQPSSLSVSGVIRMKRNNFFGHLATIGFMCFLCSRR